MTALFVHGVPETHRLWSPVVDLLSRKDVVTVDLPGFGSPVPDGFAATKEAYVDWLIQRIEQVGAPVDFVGHDWGAMLTIRIASLRPDLVRSWAGGACAVSADYEWHPLARIWQAPGRGEAFFAKLDRSEMVAQLEKDRVPRDQAERIVADVDDTMGRCILRLYRSGVEVGREWQPDLAGVAAPVLVMHGARDESVPQRFGEQLGADTRARDVVILDAGHWFPLERAEQVADALERHWAT